MSIRIDAHLPTVVLVPGLWIPAWGMIPLASRLARCGFGCVRFGYPWVSGTLDENADRLARFVAQLEAPVYLVGYSLGGVLAWYATAVHGLSQVRRIVLAGSPYAGSHAARRLAQWRLGRCFLGRTVPDWLDCIRPPPPDCEVGVIAGTRGVGMGMVVAPDLPSPHDGVIAVQETTVPGATDRIEVRVNHTAMLLSRRIAGIVCGFLRHGRFGISASDSGPRGHDVGSDSDRSAS